MPSKKGYLVPEIIDPLTRRCVTFYVPDDIWWLAAFWGQMTALADTFTWEGTEAQQAEIVQVWAGVLSSARENFDAGDCEMTLEFRVVGGIVEYRPYATAGWIAIGEACPCAPVIPVVEYNPDVVTTEELACNIAVGIIEWLMQKYSYTLDAITATTSVVGAFDAIFLIFPPAYLIADIVLDAIQEVLNATVAVARAYDTVERREEMQQWLYCEMAGIGEMTSEVWSNYKQAFIDGEFGGDSPGRAAMYAYLQTFEEEAILARSRIESYGSGNCVAFGCGFDWEQVFTFNSSDQQGWVKFASRPMTFGAAGITAGVLHNTEFNVAQRQVTIYNNMIYKDETTSIIYFRTEYTDADTGDSNTPGDADFGNQRIRSDVGGTGSLLFDSGLLNIEEGDGQVTSDPDETLEPDNSLIFYMQFAQKNDSDTVTGSGNVSKIVVRGNGKNPFIP